VPAVPGGAGAPWSPCPVERPSGPSGFLLRNGKEGGVLQPVFEALCRGLTPQEAHSSFQAPATLLARYAQHLDRELGRYGLHYNGLEEVLTFPTRYPVTHRENGALAAARRRQASWPGAGLTATGREGDSRGYPTADLGV
jgi:hypothetical protein